MVAIFNHLRLWAIKARDLMFEVYFEVFYSLLVEDSFRRLKNQREILLHSLIFIQARGLARKNTGHELDPKLKTAKNGILSQIFLKTSFRYSLQGSHRHWKTWK